MFFRVSEKLPGEDASAFPPLVQIVIPLSIVGHEFRKAFALGVMQAFFRLGEGIGRFRPGNHGCIKR